MDQKITDLPIGTISVGGEEYAPRTVASAVYVDDETTLNKEIEKMNEAVGQKTQVQLITWEDDD